MMRADTVAARRILNLTIYPLNNTATGEAAASETLSPVERTLHCPTNSRLSNATAGNRTRRAGRRRPALHLASATAELLAVNTRGLRVDDA